MSKSRFRVFWSLARLTSNLRRVSSRIPLILAESIVTFGDYSRARLTLRIIFLGLLVIGDLILNSVLSSLMSALLIFAGGKNSTTCPAIARILATRSSCDHGCVPAGIMIWALTGFAMLLLYQENKYSVFYTGSFRVCDNKLALT